MHLAPAQTLLASKHPRACSSALKLAADFARVAKIRLDPTLPVLTGTLLGATRLAEKQYRKGLQRDPKPPGDLLRKRAPGGSNSKTNP